MSVDWIVECRRWHRYHQESFQADAGSCRDTEEQGPRRHHSPGWSVLLSKINIDDDEYIHMFFDIMEFSAAGLLRCVWLSRTDFSIYSE